MRYRYRRYERKTDGVYFVIRETSSDVFGFIGVQNYVHTAGSYWAYLPTERELMNVVILDVAVSQAVLLIYAPLSWVALPCFTGYINDACPLYLKVLQHPIIFIVAVG